MFSLKNILFFFLLLNIYLVIYANLKRYPQFTYYTNIHGLSNNHVVSIVQDRYGYIWFATRNGLNRFDGNRFKTYKNIPGDSTSISNNDINCICLLRDSSLVIGTDKGLCLFNYLKENFIHIKIDDENNERRSIRCILEDSEKKLWIGSLNGIYLLNPETEIFPFQYKLVKKYTHDSDNSNSILNNKINTIIEDSKKRIWIGTPSGLSCYSPRNSLFLNYHFEEENKSGLSSSNIWTIFEDKSGYIWFGTAWNGLNRIHIYDTITPELVFQHFDQPQGLLAGKIRSIYQDSENKLWVGTHKGIFTYNKEKSIFEYYRNKLNGIDYLNDKSIRDIIEDKDGNLWIGTSEGGINTFNIKSSNFFCITIPAKEITSINPIKCLTQDKNGTIWIGTKRNGLHYIDNKNGKLKKYYNKLKDSEEPIEAVYTDKQNNIWFADLEGLYKLESSTREIKFVAKTNFLVKRIYEDSKGHLWICTLGHKLRLLDKNKLEFWRIPFLDSLLDKNSIRNINTIIEENPDCYWMATDNGLLYFNLVSKEHYQFHHDVKKVKSLSSEGVTDLFIDNNKNLWVGSSAGLYLKNKSTNEFITLGEENGLHDNFIEGILQDNENNLWVSTTGSISKLNISNYSKKNNLFQYISKLITDKNEQDSLIENFTYIESLPGNEYLGRSCLKTHVGELMFGGTLGLVYFNPEQLSYNTTIPRLVLTNFYIFNEPVQIDNNKSPLSKHIEFTKEVILKYYQNTFSFEFSALNYINPERNKYKCILYGYDDEKDGYIDIGTRNKVTYSKLPPGRYIFKVIASNNDGYWNKTGKSISIKILPPVWKTWYAYAFYILFIIGLIGLIFRYILYANKVKIDILKFRFFTNISHEIKTPLTLMTVPLEKMIAHGKYDSNLLKIMHKNAKSLITLTNQLLDFRRLEMGTLDLTISNGNIVDFVFKITEAFTGLAQKRSINLQTISSKGEIYGWFDTDKIEKIIYNLLSNAFKYTPDNGVIKVSINLINKVVKSKYYSEESNAKKYVEIIVEDTGIGIPNEKINKIFDRFYRINYGKINKSDGAGIGLSHTKELVKAHKGDITVSSRVGEGTAFTVVLPVERSSYKSASILEHVEEKSKKESVQNNVQTSKIQTEVNSDNKKNKTLPSLLLVEDNKDVRYMLRSELEDNYNIMESDNGNTGFDIATRHIPDIIVSDIMMHGMDGLKLCEKIKKDERTSHIPFILLTALSSIDHKLKGLDTKADDYISKPYNLHELKTRVRNLIEHQQKLKEKFKRDFLLEPKEIIAETADEKFLKNLINIIEENIVDTELSGEILCKKLNTSKRHIYRKLKVLTGQSVNELIRIIRLKTAAKMLIKKTDNISQIAYSVGFKSPAYFTQCFKDYFQVSPREYQISHS